jgi:hypothetical protein
MASRFECVGFPLNRDESSATGLAEIVRGIFEEGRPLPAPEGLHAAEWTSPEGASARAAVSLDATAGRMDLRCFTPGFAGATRRRVKVFRALPDPGCPICDFLHGELLGEEGAPGSPLLLEIQDGRYRRESDFRGAEIAMQVGLFAQEVRAFPGREEFLAGRPEPIEPGSFLPAGLLVQPRSATAKAAGEVVAAERLVNPLGKGAFHHARVRVLGGEIDVLAAAADLPGGLVPGQFVFAHGSLVGRFLEEPPGV